MKTFTTRYGRKLRFDEQRWSLRTQNHTCQIVGEREDDYLLLDANTLVTWVPKATIRDVFSSQIYRFPLPAFRL